jgi:hypothetical protein
VILGTDDETPARTSAALLQQFEFDSRVHPPTQSDPALCIVMYGIVMKIVNKGKKKTKKKQFAIGSGRSNKGWIWIRKNFKNKVNVVLEFVILVYYS